MLQWRAGPQEYRQILLNQEKSLDLEKPLEWRRRAVLPPDTSRPLMELLTRCRDFALPFYGDLLHSSQQTLVERLFEQASNGSSNVEERCYFEAIQQIKERGDAMRLAFSDELQIGYEDFLAGREIDPTPPLQTAGLTLVAREQLEDQLAVSMIVSRADTQHAEALWKLNRRLAVLRGGRKVGDEDNPFGPARVGAALRVAMRSLDVEFKARLFIYKHLGKLLLVSFGRVFDTLNQTLAEGGVLANLRFSLEKEAAGKQAAAQAEPQAAADGGAEQQRLYAAIVDVLRRRWATAGARQQTAGGVGYGGLGTGRDGAAGNFLPMDLALVLSALQQAPEFSASGVMQRSLPIDVVEQRLFASLRKQASPEKRHQLAASDADTVDLVGLIFRYMLDDAGLPDLVKSLLSHLHTPYLKLALLDRTFLESQEHPARLLLDRMAAVGTRWVGDDKDRVALPKLKAVVETILRGFVDDTDLFGRLLEDFERFCQSLEKRAEMVEKRNRAAQEGVERLHAARQRAGEDVQARIGRLLLPEPVRELLEKPWTDFLAFNLLRNGDGSAAWEAALKVVDGVLWSLQFGHTRGADEFQQYREQLRQALADGMQTIGYDGQAAATLLAALDSAQMQAREAGAPLPETADEIVVAPVAAGGPVTPEQLELAGRLRNDTAFGTLFDFDCDGPAPQRLKLAWFSRISEHYMFVNQAGVKQRLETLAFLAEGLAAGRIRIVEAERRGFMERALHAVLARLAPPPN
jgi:hypothetical protein